MQNIFKMQSWVNEKIVESSIPLLPFLPCYGVVVFKLTKIYVTVYINYVTT